MYLTYRHLFPVRKKTNYLGLGIFFLPETSACALTLPNTIYMFVIKILSLIAPGCVAYTLCAK